MNIEWIIGGLLVLLHAFGRYNTPKTNRASTTFRQFLAYGLFYCVVMLTIYVCLAAFLDSSPQNVALLENLLRTQGFDVTLIKEQLTLGSENAAIASALILTAMIPNLPWLKKFDQRLLQLFWDLGRIPVFVLQYGESLLRGNYLLSAARLQAVYDYAERFGLDHSSLSLEERSSTDHAWAKMVSVQLELDRWRNNGNGRIRRYLVQNQLELASIRSTVEDLSLRLAEFKRHKPSFTKDFLRSDIAAVYKRITIFVAGLLCSCEFRDAARRQRSRELGYENGESHTQYLSANDIVLVCGSMFVAFLVVSYADSLARPQNGENVNSLFRSLLWMTTYGAAIVATLSLKSRPVFAYNELTSQRPWVGYLLSGLIALCTWVVVAGTFRYSNVMLFSPQLDSAATMVKVLENMEWSYPYALQSIVVAFGLAWCVDGRVPADRRRFGRLRSIDVLLMVVLMFLSSAFIYACMYGMGPYMTKGAEFVKPEQQTMGALFWFAVKHAVIGAVIGYLVPNWYRVAHARRPYTMVQRMIGMNEQALEDEARRLGPKQLLQGFTAITLAVGGAKDQLGRDETEVFEVIMTKLSALESADFTIEEAQKCLQEMRERFDADILIGALQPLRSLEKLQMLCGHYAVAVAYADRVFLQEEERKVAEIFSLLSLDVPPNKELSTGLLARA